LDEIIYSSAGSLARAIREKKASAAEVVKAHLDRIEEVNPSLNAVVQLSADRALAEAREADARLARAEPVGPLHGVPFTIKDSFDTEDIITT
jgi:Asp-tRNA(Asn)/Glu-tRNA(Gln) amidotransferase A subunit family amidase